MEYFLPYAFCPVCNISSETASLQTEDESLMKIHDIDNVNLKELASSESRLRTAEAAADKLTLTDYQQGGTVVEVGPLSVTLYDGNLKGECKGVDKIIDEK